MKQIICITLLLSLGLPCLATEPQHTEREQELFDLINERREQVNLPPMIFCPVILEGSREWAEKLHSERRLYHWHGGRENCGRGYQTPRAMFYGWRSSSGHNALLHSRAAVYAAIGEHENYWVLRVALSSEEYQTRANRNKMTRLKQIIFHVHYDVNRKPFFNVYATHLGAEKAVTDYIALRSDSERWERLHKNVWTDGGDKYITISELELQE